MIDRKAIDELPVMQLESGQKVPEGAETRRAWLKYVNESGKELGHVETIVARTEGKDIFFVPKGQPNVQMIPAENVRLYTPYR